MKLIKANKKARRIYMISLIVFGFVYVSGFILRQYYHIYLLPPDIYPQASVVFTLLCLIAIFSILSYSFFQEAKAIIKTGRSPSTDKVVFDTEIVTGEAAINLAKQTLISAWVMVFLALVTTFTMVLFIT